ncbi:helix-turn-helix transcriptional regulator [Pseudarthrobacter sp. AL07]|uniref:helix-turn-helix domain-containing protein n=1 Tax=unclassified Pseudarthrobacter TaxID=2647000 RepID=UPI00249AB244|nr:MULTISPECIES: helix-turn-helix transcriptional regulator [unclassified Pseudarthrobacter]MDI3193978.1 helix-turn-helix transcriptional regulator [Pseudarthrobacter sp. AL20]MDI3208061.1 helix-turn-helix transcriptional regulator [Pseudarthrobacter sp. AL07]
MGAWVRAPSSEDAGAEATSGARRVPGLRREEVARLAGVSTDYYIRLEQGRNIHPSRSVLDSVSRALRLDAGQHAHMAYLLFTDFRDLPAHEVNLTRWLVLDPGARELFRAWKTVAADEAGALRVDVGRHPNDPEANQLVGELAVLSEQFRQWWAGRRVATRSAGSIRLHHPAVGDLELNFEHLVLQDDPDQTLRVYSAKPGSPPSDALALLSLGLNAGTGSAVAPPGTTLDLEVLPPATAES